MLSFTWEFQGLGFLVELTFLWTIAFSKLLSYVSLFLKPYVIIYPFYVNRFLFYSRIVVFFSHYLVFDFVEKNSLQSLFFKMFPVEDSGMMLACGMQRPVFLSPLKVIEWQNWDPAGSPGSLVSNWCGSGFKNRAVVGHTKGATTMYMNMYRKMTRKR